MGRINLQKGSEEFELFRDFWNLLQENWDVEDSDTYWQKVVDDCHAFYQKYNSPLAKELAIVYADELERRRTDADKNTGSR